MKSARKNVTYNMQYYYQFIHAHHTWYIILYVSNNVSWQMYLKILSTMPLI